jgi:hypothetical protein
VRYRLLRLFGADGEGEGEGEGGTSSEGSGEGEGSDKPENRSLSEEELSKITARAADRASRSARKKMAEDLGFDSVSALNDWAKAQRDEADAKKSESDKAAEKLATDQKAATQERLDNARDRRQVKIERAIIRTGVVDEKKVDRLLTLVEADIEVGDDEDLDSQITEALESLKGDMPELFALKKGHGSGDGGSEGGSDDDTDDGESEEEKAWREEYEARGPIELDLTKVK